MIRNKGHELDSETVVINSNISKRSLIKLIHEITNVMKRPLHSNYAGEVAERAE